MSAIDSVKSVERAKGGRVRMAIDSLFGGIERVSSIPSFRSSRRLMIAAALTTMLVPAAARADDDLLFGLVGSLVEVGGGLVGAVAETGVELARVSGEVAFETARTGLETGVMTAPMIVEHRNEIAALAAAHGLPVPSNVMLAMDTINRVSSAMQTVEDVQTLARTAEDVGDLVDFANGLMPEVEQSAPLASAPVAAPPQIIADLSSLTRPIAAPPTLVR